MSTPRLLARDTIRAQIGRRRLGVGISCDALHAVVVRNDRIIWAREVLFDIGSAGAWSVLERELCALLRSVPTWAGRRPPLVAAVGPSVAQLKLLHGLPALADLAAMESVVRHGANRFFLESDVPLVTAGVRPAASGTVWAAAFEQPIVDVVQRACADTRTTLRGIVPTLAVLGAAMREDGRVAWRDGDVLSTIDVENGTTISVTRRRDPIAGGAAQAPCADEMSTAAALAPPLSHLADSGWRFAASYGAAVRGDREPLVWRVAHNGARHVISARRAGLAIGVSIFALAVALLVPPLVDAAIAHRDAKGLAVLAAQRGGSERIERDLVDATRALGEVAAFQHSRRSVTAVLRELSAALPDGATLLSVHLDADTASVVALTPSSSAFVARLEQVASFIEPEIIGPVLRETSGGRENDRVTVQIRLARSGE